MKKKNLEEFTPVLFELGPLKDPIYTALYNFLKTKVYKNKILMICSNINI